MDFNISNRFGKRISRETKDQIGCFKQYFHGDLGCCEEKRSAVNDTIKQTKKTPPPELSADELKVKFDSLFFIYTSLNTYHFYLFLYY